MNFSADFANDLLRSLEATAQADGRSRDWIYTDASFARNCANELLSSQIKLSLYDKHVSLYLRRFNDNERELRNIERLKLQFDINVYLRLKKRNSNRKHEITQQYERYQKLFNEQTEVVKEFAVLRYVQKTGLRRIWSHPDYDIEKMTEKQALAMTSLVSLFKDDLVEQDL